MQEFYLTQFLDVFDANNKWRVATVLKIQEDSLLVSFDGWSGKWNETHPKNSSKIAPFRKFTSGYTGQAKKAVRSGSESDTLEGIEKVLR